MPVSTHAKRLPNLWAVIPVRWLALRDMWHLCQGDEPAPKAIAEKRSSGNRGGSAQAAHGVADLPRSGGKVIRAWQFFVCLAWFLATLG